MTIDAQQAAEETPALPLLATKLYVPPAREKAIARPRLVDRLLSGVQRPGTLTLVSGPAGFGKTTLLSALAARIGDHVAWLSLDEADSVPARFWAYVIAACRSVLPDMGSSVLELLHDAQRLPDQTVPTLLINDLVAQDQRIVLILDDYHEISSASIHAGLLFLLEHLPTNLRIVVSSRTDPPWPLVRFRARNRLVEVRAQDLRFDLPEATAFLNRTMGLNLDHNAVAALAMRTEGWVAGLQLAGLSLQGRSDVEHFVQAFTGSHVYVAEYLIGEVLLRQSEKVQRFLAQTSILERLSADLCEAMTGIPDAQEILQELHRTNTFLVPLDDEERWFRYHHLFADLLQMRLKQNLEAAELRELHTRAAAWYEENGALRDAVTHSFAAGDAAQTAELIERAGQTMLFTDQAPLRRWLDQVAPEQYATHPRLEIYRVLIDLSQGTLDMSEETLRSTEQLIASLPPSPEDERLRMGAMVYLSLFMAHQNTSHALEIAQAVLPELPTDALRLRAYLHSALYRAYGMEGDIERSAPAYRECLRLAQAWGQYGMVAITTMVRAFDLCQYGRLDEAARYCQLILDAGTELGRDIFYPAGPALIGLAGIHLERYELEAAEDMLAEGIELCRQSGSDGLYTGYLQRARLLQARGDLPGALAALGALQRSIRRQDFTLTGRQVSVHLAMGDTAAASRIATTVKALLQDRAYARHLPLIAREAFSLSLARVALSQGDVVQARALLDDVEVTVTQGQRWGRLMEICTLRALIELLENPDTIPGAAVTTMTRALELAQPSGMKLLILEEGRALVPLLQAIIGRHTMPDALRRYAGRLLSALGEGDAMDVAAASQGGPALVEPLTPRETEVLDLVAAGDANREIADKLFVTVRTVKKHVSNILGKLGVSNRTQAAARARELGLLEPE